MLGAWSALIGAWLLLGGWGLGFAGILYGLILLLGDVSGLAGLAEMNWCLPW